MNMNQQCTLDVMKANSILDCISKSVASRLRKMLIPFCSGLIKLLPEYCVLCTGEILVNWKESAGDSPTTKDHKETRAYDVEDNFRELGLITLQKAAAKEGI